MENSTNTSEDMNSDISEGKPSLQATLDSGKPSNSCEEVADGGKDSSVLADRSNRVQVKIDSSLDENSFPYSKYDKDEPELKGPITSRPQYQEYFQELKDKNEIYLSLRKIVQDNGDVIKKLTVESEDAKAMGDMDRYNAICEQINESHMPIYKKRKKVYDVLEAELSSIKQRINELAESMGHKRKHPGTDFHAHDLSSVQKDISDGDARNEKIQATEKKIPRNFTDGSNGSKLSQLGASPKDNIRIDLNQFPDDMNSAMDLYSSTDGSNGSKLPQLGASPKDNIRIDLNQFPDDMNSGFDLYGSTDGINGSKPSQLGASPKDNIRIDLNRFPPEDMNLDITEGYFKHINTSEDMNLDP